MWGYGIELHKTYNYDIDYKYNCLDIINIAY